MADLGSRLACQEGLNDWSGCLGDPRNVGGIMARGIKPWTRRVLTSATVCDTPRGHEALPRGNIYKHGPGQYRSKLHVRGEDHRCEGRAKAYVRRSVCPASPTYSRARNRACEGVMIVLERPVERTFGFVDRGAHRAAHLECTGAVRSHQSGQTLTTRVLPLARRMRCLRSSADYRTNCQRSAQPWILSSMICWRRDHDVTPALAHRRADLQQFQPQCRHLRAMQFTGSEGHAQRLEEDMPRRRHQDAQLVCQEAEYAWSGARVILWRTPYARRRSIDQGTSLERHAWRSSSERPTHLFHVTDLIRARFGLAPYDVRPLASADA